MEEKSADLNHAYNSKMNAAHFFLKKIQEIYGPERLHQKSIPDEFFYYLDGVVFELHAASQLLLQIVNLKARVNKPPNRVSWNNSFQIALKKANPCLYAWWCTINASAEFHVPTLTDSTYLIEVKVLCLRRWIRLGR